jgi:hypothetical protein
MQAPVEKKKIDPYNYCYELRQQRLPKSRNTFLNLQLRTSRIVVKIADSWPASIDDSSARKTGTGIV